MQIIHGMVFKLLPVTEMEMQGRWRVMLKDQLAMVLMVTVVVIRT
jgi:hypothetical protein